MLAGMLMPLGFDVREAASGVECLDSLRERVPSAILLDIGMDDMDGWETATRVRAAGYEQVPIVIVSANVFENQAERLRATGCQGFVGKPVIESELIAMLERQLGLQWLQHAPPPAAPAGLGPSGADESPGAAAGPIVLPEEARLELVRLVQLGHVRGLQQAIDRLAAADPMLAVACTQLRGMVTRFELDDVKNALQETPDVTIPAPL
jgi:CheY-like chemotaxis protein